MSGWNGTGGFVRIYNWVQDANNAIDITASRMDADTDNITNNGFNNTLTRDGQGSASADLPMNGFKHTGVGDAVLANQYATLGQLQGASSNYVIAGGSGDAITATFSPAIASLTDGLLVRVIAPGANTGTTPTFSPNGLSAHTIKKGAATAVDVGDYVTGQPITLQYVASGTYWALTTLNFGSASILDATATGGASGKVAVHAGNVSAMQLYYAFDSTGKIASTTFSYTDLPLLSNNGSDYIAATFRTNIAVSASATPSENSLTKNGAFTSGNLVKTTGTTGSMVDAGVTPASFPLLSNNGSDYTPATFRTNIGLTFFMSTAFTTTALGANQAQTSTHGLGALPTNGNFRVEFWVKCISADLSYAANDWVPVADGAQDGSGCWVNATTCGYLTNSTGVEIRSRTTNNVAAINTAKWEGYLKVWYN